MAKDRFDLLKKRKLLKTILSNQKIMLIPMVFFFILLIIRSANFPLHDYSNSYFPALLAKENISPETIVFDIFSFNSYAWQRGYEGVFSDFYLNSPFTSTFFYPFTFFGDAFDSKLIFNSISIVLFIMGIFVLLKKYENVPPSIALIFPILFCISLRNNVLFGQSYLLIVSFLILGIWLIEKNKNLAGIFLIVLSTLIKIFPIYYMPILAFNKKWKAIILGLTIALLMLVLSSYLAGYNFWFTYLFEALPNAISNESTVDFRVNSQSFNVLLKKLLIYDPYYNPEAPFDSYLTYKIILTSIKAILIGVAISYSVVLRRDLFKLLGVWVVIGFLIQSRTATYSQILWIIPLVIYLSSEASLKAKVGFLFILFLASNFPFQWLGKAPIVLQFARLWLTVILAFMYFKGIKKTIQFKYIVMGFSMFIIMSLSGFSKPIEDNSRYVLNTAKYFIIYDFSATDKKLAYNIIDRDGSKQIITDIAISSFDTSSCKIINNQIFLNKDQLTNDPSLKKKPVIVNNCDVYYLTDRMARRGAFTLKKLNICNR